MTGENPAGRRTVDAHQHFWTADALPGQSWRSAKHDVIARAYTPDDLAPELARAGVESTVLMQAADRPDENDSIFRFAADAPFVAGVVAWLPLAEPGSARAELARVAEHASLAGVRCLIGRDSIAWAAGPAVVDVLARLAEQRLCWDVVPVNVDQVGTVLEVADRLPDLRIVINHLARPPLEDGGWEPWATSVAALAERPNIAIKLSVGVDILTGWSGWSVSSLRPYVEHAMSCFGADRAMLASNWPVSLLHVDYPGAWGDVRGLVEDLGADSAEMAQVSGGTATSWYDLAER